MMDQLINHKEKNVLNSEDKYWTLLNAAFDGNVKEVERLLNEGQVDVARNLKGSTLCRSLEEYKMTLIEQWKKKDRTEEDWTKIHTLLLQYERP
jgi:chromatin remodeling complex protein RSC6